METLTISLSKGHLEFVQEQVATGGFRSVNAYMDKLLRAERRRKAEEKLLALVQEAEASGPATEWTTEDWEAIRREVLGNPSPKKPRSKAGKKQK